MNSTKPINATIKVAPIRRATCTSAVPESLSHNGKPIVAGTTIEYSRIAFRNGENHLVMADKSQVPACFFVF